MRYLLGGIMFVVAYALLVEWLGWAGGTVLTVALVCLGSVMRRLHS